jgi:hypothetical protein
MERWRDGEMENGKWKMENGKAAAGQTVSWFRCGIDERRTGLPRAPAGESLRIRRQCVTFARALLR